MHQTYPISTWSPTQWPNQIHEIPQPAKQLYIRGNFIPENKLLCVVGSRKYTSYGKQVCESLIEGLSSYPISVVSGLALGIDGIAHQSALKANLHTIAIPGSGISDKGIHPRTNYSLAQNILRSGGCLISEFEPDEKPQPHYFPQRNRIMAGLCDAVLIIEATKKSGTLITARLGLDYNREVMTVPGSIYSYATEGPHYLLSQGAHPVTKSQDILDVLGFSEKLKDGSKELEGLSESEKEIIGLLSEPQERDFIYQSLHKSISEINQILTVLELKGIIKESGGLIQKL